MTSAGKIVHILLILLAAVVTQVFFLLALQFFRQNWQHWVYLTVLWGGSALNLLLFAADVAAVFWGKEFLYKFCILAYILLVFSAVVFYVLLRTGFLEIVKSESTLEEYLERTGNWMSILFVVLQFLQVVILPIPSTVTVVAGSALFGPLKGSLFSLTGIVLGSLAAFWVGRYAGYPVVAWLVGKDTLEKWLKKVKGKDKLLLSAMFLLPVFPDDVLCFVAGLSSMSLGLFLAVILLSRVLAIFSTSYSITLIPFNTWWGILIWSVLLLGVAVLFVVLYKKSDAILAWFERHFHREMKVEEKTADGQFTLEVVGPDGTRIRKGVTRSDKTPPDKKEPK